MNRLGRSIHARPAPRQTGEPTLPLINVVFLLLIFVLLTSVIEAEPPVPVELAVSDTSPLAEDAGDVVFLSADGREATGLAILDEAGLRDWVAQNEPDLVAIRADQETPARLLFDLAGRLEELGVRSIDLVVLTP